MRPKFGHYSTQICLFWLPKFEFMTGKIRAINVELIVFNFHKRNCELKIWKYFDEIQSKNTNHIVKM